MSKKLKSLAMPWYVVLTILALLSTTAGAHATVMVSASCRAIILEGNGSSPDPVSGGSCADLVSAPITGTISDSRNAGILPPTGIMVDAADASYTARGDYGNLGVGATTDAGIPVAETHYYAALGQASVTVTATDTISVTSALLAAGTYVSINLGGYFEGNVGGAYGPSWTINPYNVADSFVASSLLISELSNGIATPISSFDSCFSFLGPCTQTSGGFFQSYTDTIWVQVGSTLLLSSLLTASSESQALNLISGYDNYGQSVADAMNSFATFLTPITDGVQLLADSGHDYSYVSPPQSVPEPATLALVGLGLFGLAAARRRKQNNLS